MKPKEIYHVYNRGNNRQPIFFEEENYHYFLRKLKQYLAPNCEILAYCLMSNHFHLLVSANERSNRLYKSSNRRFKNVKLNPRRIPLTYFSWGLQQLLSTYARGINKKYNRTGSLFQQNTKCKKTSSEFFTEDYSVWCFKYIHQNAQMAGLVNSPEEYPFTSYRDYLEQSNNSICNLSLAKKLLCLEENENFQCTSVDFPEEIITKIF